MTSNRLLFFLLMGLASLSGKPTSEDTAQNRSRDWPQFLGPTRDGVYRGGDLEGGWPREGPRVLWKLPVGQGFSGPVLSGNRLILFHRLKDREIVECLETSGGRKLWSYDYPTRYRDDFGFDPGPRATPAISGNRVYTFGAEGVLHCLDLADGKKVWSVDTHEQFRVPKGFFGAACSPLVEENKVLMNIGGPAGSGVVAFDKESGAVLWKATDDEAGYASPTAATIAGARHALFFTRNGLVDLDPETGQARFGFRWRARMNASVNAATPLVVGDLLFVSASYGTGAVLGQVNGNTWKEIWSSDEVLSNHYATSVYLDGHLYGFHGRQEQSPSLRCVELLTGKVRWSVDRFGGGTLVRTGSHLLILKENGELILAAASPKAYKVLGQTRLLSATARACFGVSAGRIFARNEDSLVCASLLE
ncbi:MAG: PQQ-binding-like beta-propeller repeat protein [Acidobacteriota bacterium]